MPLGFVMTAQSLRSRHVKPARCVEAEGSRCLDPRPRGAPSSPDPAQATHNAAFPIARQAVTAPTWLLMRPFGALGGVRQPIQFP
jgi:hypothetical protein